MGPIEVTFFIIVFIFFLIGLARGYRSELGSTLIIMVAIFILSFLDEQITGVLTEVNSSVLQNSSNTGLNELSVLTFSTLFIVFVFAGYAGRTLDFPGTEAPPPLGSLLSMALGILNGYLVGGSLWYYLDRYDYPFGIFERPLTETANNLVPLLPQVIFPSPTWWIFPVAVLLLLRVRG